MSLPTIELAPPPLTDLAATEPGTRVAHLRWPGVTRTQLAYYCAATGVTDPIHYDRVAAADHGFADVVVNGSFRLGMAELAVATLWPAAVVVELTCRHRGALLVARPVDAYVAAGPDHSVEVTHHAGDVLTDTCVLTLAVPGG